MELFLLLGLPPLMAVIVFVLPQERARKAILLATGFIHLMTTISFWYRPHHVQFNAFLGFDALSKLFLTLISILFFIISMYIAATLKEGKGRPNKLFIGCLLCLLAAMTLVTMSRHMGLFWIAIEATTLLNVPLINYYRTPQSIEASWKYLLISSLGIALSLLGTLFLAISATTIKTVFLPDILSNGAFLSPAWLKMSMIFLLVGYGTKMGLAPMHTWLPDAHSEAPSPVSALLSGVLLNCAFLGILRVFQICAAAGQTVFAQDLLMVMGLLSLAISSVFVIGQSDYKRMFAYSSVENMGILAIGMAMGGIGLYASLYHAINNAFAKSMVFLVTGNIYQFYQSKKVNDVKGLIHSYPMTGIFLAMGFLAVTGFPPFGTFYSELMILNTALEYGRFWVAFLYLLFLSVIFIGLADNVLKMLQGEAKGQATGQANKEDIRSLIPILLLGSAVLILGVHMPSFLDHALKEASALLGGG